MARRLIREEGLLCGGSSGTAMVAAIQAAQELGEGQRCVVILPDSVRNYMSKFLNDSWMLENDWLDITDENANQPWYSKTVQDLNLKPARTVLPSMTIGEAVGILDEEGFDQMPVVNDEGHILGTVTLAHLTSLLLSKKAQKGTPVEQGLFQKHRVVSSLTTLGQLSRIFQTESFVVVVENQHVVSVASRIDLVKFIE